MLTSIPFQVWDTFELVDNLKVGFLRLFWVLLVHERLSRSEGRNAFKTFDKVSYVLLELVLFDRKMRQMPF